MRHFTTEEFNAMVEELLYSGEQSRFDTLYDITEKTLRKSVKYWCSRDGRLCGRGYEDDIMQEIHLRLIKTTVTYFLKRNGIEGEYNNDPEGFEDWIFRVAKNIKEDFAKKVQKHDGTSEDIECESGPVDEPDIEIKEILKEVFSIVISADVSVYKVLTWLAHSIFMLTTGATKIKANEFIINEFEDKTLNDMYDMILHVSEKISWLEISESQNERIMNALRKTREDTVTYGETKYKEFFMKSKGEPSGKKSLSDWINRMNNMIAGGIELYSEDENKSDDKKRRNNDESSDN